MNDTIIDEICNGKVVTDERRENLARAAALGADRATLEALRDAARLKRAPYIVLPPHRFEGLSRGRGWARSGKGVAAQWGERVDSGYKVDPGRWCVGGSDGFQRKREDLWIVEHVQVGAETWTIAN